MSKPQQADQREIENKLAVVEGTEEETREFFGEGPLY